MTRAIAAAKESAGENDLIFIGGSSFIVADALPLYV
jgi:dihydrofolate synthase/folylpolyglutamate synthase